MFRLTGLLLVIAGAIFAWLGSEDLIATAKRSSAAEDVIAQVLRFDPDPAGGGFFPIAGFTGDDGRRYEARLPAVRQPDAATGTPVHLIHPPGRPDLAETGELAALWGPALIPTGGGLLAIVIGLGMATSRRRRPEEMPRVHVAVRAGLFLVAFGLVYLAWQEYAAVVETLNRFPRTEGRVVALDQGAPVVRFLTGDGKAVEYTDRSVAPEGYREGEAVVVGYAKSNPAGARIESFSEVWAGPALWGTIAAAALMIALFVSSIRRGKQAIPPAPPLAEAPAEEPPPPAPPTPPAVPLGPAEPLSPLRARLQQPSQRREPSFDREPRG